MTAKIFIDGEHGTTGLQIRDRLARRGDIELLSLPAEDRRDEDKRKAMLRAADIAILCLPDEAARQAVRLAEGADTRFIDASTAHRTQPDWVYGFAEAEPGQAQRIANAQFVSNPGCYSTGAIGLLRPLILAGLLPTDYPVTVNAVSGYSGGGKQMIRQMEDQSAEDRISAPFFAYALSLRHKHVPEIMERAGLTVRPIFTPSVGRFAQGMLVNVPLFSALLTGHATHEQVQDVLETHYSGQSVVRVAELDETEAMARIDATEMAGTDRMTIHVCGTPGDGQMNLVASLDNLGKGAAGAAVQNLELMLGAVPETQLRFD
ncbi:MULTISPECIES: N-acetyl-gamma-glutamyl-phosphate reductase [unclassified Roseitalea]|uniref:N-acetyl-gamma-glutamyl-phosphate reductase n=1 Tax=unclassified Roseitalea TaxID=2639107 RepID=UPI00273F8B76|nr:MULTISPECIES: N-acetyl-gamma-glutamyl-phosphate reductase [unclassified Roseitalea]